jgi:hypothetical protein
LTSPTTNPSTSGPDAPALDHLVVAASDLKQGTAWVESRLGVPLSPGGTHELFSTHNALLSLGGSSYLEVIAADPAATSHRRPRWFGLDEPATAARLAQGPRLLHWVVRVPQLPEGYVDPHGVVLALHRGGLSWRLTVPADGRLVGGGTVPSLIAWDGPHPTERLADVGVRLRSLALHSPRAEELAGVLERIGAEGPVTVEDGPAGLRAALDTPGGPVLLEGP